MVDEIACWTGDQESLASHGFGRSIVQQDKADRRQQRHKPGKANGNAFDQGHGFSVLSFLSSDMPIAKGVV